MVRTIILGYTSMVLYYTDLSYIVLYYVIFRHCVETYGRIILLAYTRLAPLKPVEEISKQGPLKTNERNQQHPRGLPSIRSMLHLLCAFNLARLAIILPILLPVILPVVLAVVLPGSDAYTIRDFKKQMDVDRKELPDGIRYTEHYELQTLNLLIPKSRRPKTTQPPKP